MSHFKQPCACYQALRSARSTWYKHIARKVGTLNGQLAASALRAQQEHYAQLSVHDMYIAPTTQEA